MISKEKKQEIIASYGRTANDTGSPEVQIALLTTRINELNEHLNNLNNLEEWEREEIAAAVDAFGYSFMEAYEKQQQGYFILYRNQDLEDVAYDLINECYFTKDTPDIFERYFDYSAFARDLSYDGYVETEWGVIYEG